ncbi:hypothetical protein [Tenacibaculum sp. M341]|uniref:hypothetical protein n=1 Tax=Tenacibaculum sp. M341 TaxID=2530339 RepID=UPI001043C3DE|nr:hypothetical protein [Tenacibaculum sp. M341]TCI94968.1 hypothetical protein EYW44_01205 [Tenacibaculum sp. M341]
MKKITLKFICIVCLTAFGFNLKAQKNTSNSLNSIITSGEVITNSNEKATSALRTLTVEYFFGQTPNTTGFLAIINKEFATIEEYSDEIISFAYNAENLNPNLEVDEIVFGASQIEGIGDGVENDSQALVTAINSNNVSEVQRLIGKINQGFIGVSNYVEEIIDVAKDLKEIPQTFNVRIELVDNNGNSISADTLPGYFAQNLATNVYFSAGENQGDPIDLFFNLEEGSYRFDAFDGYFDGASSKTITLSNDLVEADGFIVVTLRYWSE